MTFNSKVCMSFLDGKKCLNVKNFPWNRIALKLFLTKSIIRVALRKITEACECFAVILVDLLHFVYLFFFCIGYDITDPKWSSYWTKCKLMTINQSLFSSDFHIILLWIAWCIDCGQKINFSRSSMLLLIWINWTIYLNFGE